VPILCKPFDVPQLLGVLHTLSVAARPQG